MKTYRFTVSRTNNGRREYQEVVIEAANFSEARHKLNQLINGAT